jgi:hypothetical protein
MLKRAGWLFVFVIMLGLFGLAATIDVGSALPITQGDHGAALEALPGNLLLLAKTKTAARSRRCVLRQLWRLVGLPTGSKAALSGVLDGLGPASTLRWGALALGVEARPMKRDRGRV